MTKGEQREKQWNEEEIKRLEKLLRKYDEFLIEKGLVIEFATWRLAKEIFG